MFVPPSGARGSTMYAPRAQCKQIELAKRLVDGRNEPSIAKESQAAFLLPPHSPTTFAHDCQKYTKKTPKNRLQRLYLRVLLLLQHSPPPSLCGLAVQLGGSESRQSGQKRTQKRPTISLCDMNRTYDRISRGTDIGEGWR